MRCRLAPGRPGRVSTGGRYRSIASGSIAHPAGKTRVGWDGLRKDSQCIKGNEGQRPARRVAPGSLDHRPGVEARCLVAAELLDLRARAARVSLPSATMHTGALQDIGLEVDCDGVEGFASGRSLTKLASLTDPSQGCFAVTPRRKSSRMAPASACVTERCAAVVGAHVRVRAMGQISSSNGRRRRAAGQVKAAAAALPSAVAPVLTRDERGCCRTAKSSMSSEIDAIDALDASIASLNRAEQRKPPQGGGISLR
jgi:hypothetical protein